MKRFSFSSLRVRLLLLVFLAVIPALGITLYTGLEHRRIEATRAKEEALHLARLVSNRQQQIIEGAHQFLYTLSQLPQVRNCDPVVCSTLFNDLQKKYTYYLNIGAATLDGNIFASALPLAKRVNITDRPYFQQAIKTRKFSIGEYQIGRITRKPGVNFGYPVIDEIGKVKAVVFIALDLDWLNQLTIQAELPKGSTLNLIDHNSTILARHPEPEKWVGKTIPEATIIKTILAQGEGMTETVDIDGVQRLYAFTSFGSTVKEAGKIFISIGIPTSIAFGQVNRILTRNLAFLGLVTLFALMAVWFIGDLLILRQVNALVSATKRLSTGNLSVQTGIPYGKGELNQLAQAFDEMAESLEHRETERKRAEEALRQSEERYRTLVEESFDGIFIQKGPKIIFANRPLYEMLGYEKGEIEGMDHWLVYHPDYQELTRERARVRMQGENVPSQYEVKLQRKDGSSFDGEINARRIIFGNEPGIQVWTRDITERKQAEKKLRESEEKYRTILENIEEGYYEVDIAGNFTFFNDSLCRMLGYIKDELMGMNNRQYTDQENAKKLYQAFNKVYKTGEPEKGFDWKVIRKDGTIRFVEASVSL